MEELLYKLLVLLSRGFWGAVLFMGTSSVIILFIGWLKIIFFPAINDIFL